MKIRVNDLARELEVKSKAILDVLQEVGVTEKKTHSSPIEDHEAEKVRRYFTNKSNSASARKEVLSAEIKPKIDLSKIGTPGDVLRLLREREKKRHDPTVGHPVAISTAARFGSSSLKVTELSSPDRKSVV